MFHYIRLLLVVATIGSIGPALHDPGDWRPRIKDLATFEIQRGLRLRGFGIAAGLPGTGDIIEDGACGMAGMVRHSCGGRLQDEQGLAPDSCAPGNHASVFVTARLRKTAIRGEKFDVAVTGAGNSRVITGGILLPTPLKGPDGVIQAVAQGMIQPVEGAAAGWK